MGKRRIVSESMTWFVRQVEAARIDAAFEAMADDPDHQADLLRVERDLSPASEVVWVWLDSAERRAGRPE